MTGGWGVDAGGLDQLRQRLAGAPAVIAAALDQAMAVQARALAAAAGGRLNDRTKGSDGALARALIPTVTVQELGVVAGVAVDPSAPAAAYAAFQEYGFHGTETVPEHLRTITQAFGRAIAPVSVPVRAHDRRVDYDGHPFLAPTLDAAADGIRAALAAAGQALARQLDI